jgi:hypothetical protein
MGLRYGGRGRFVATGGAQHEARATGVAHRGVLGDVQQGRDRRERQPADHVQQQAGARHFGQRLQRLGQFVRQLFGIETERAVVAAVGTRQRFGQGRGILRHRPALPPPVGAGVPHDLREPGAMVATGREGRTTLPGDARSLLHQVRRIATPDPCGREQPQRAPMAGERRGERVGIGGFKTHADGVDGRSAVAARTAASRLRGRLRDDGSRSLGGRFAAAGLAAGRIAATRVAAGGCAALHRAAQAAWVAGSRATERQTEEPGKEALQDRVHWIVVPVWAPAHVGRRRRPCKDARFPE